MLNPLNLKIKHNIYFIIHFTLMGQYQNSFKFISFTDFQFQTLFKCILVNSTMFLMVNLIYYLFLVTIQKI